MRNNHNRKIIYIRHGEDKRGHYKYDEKLTDYGKKKVKDLTKQLIDTYGFPDIIYYSPYYRTRQTKRLMLSVIDRDYGEELPPTKCDSRLSRFFTKRQSRNPDIRKDTRKRGAPIYETWREFKYRVGEHISEMESNRQHHIIWCVTHTLVLDYVINHRGIDHDYEIPYLDTIIL